jgi:glycosyltransferase involved in cell wall biosynthesis
MRVLHTEWSDGWGGQERRVMSDLVGMRERGHQVFLVTRPGTRIGKEAELAGIPVFRLAMASNLDLISVVRLALLLRRQNIEVVNTHSGVDTWVGSLAAKLARVPALVRSRHLHLPLKRSWLNFVHYLPDALVASGETMRGYLIKDCGFPAPKVVSIPTGIRFESLAPLRDRAAVRKELGVAAEAFLILMVGVIRGVKRHELALRALHVLVETVPGAQLVLAGEGPMRPDMERLAEQLGLADRVLFLGQRSDVGDLMNAADVLLLTSRSEGVPQAVTQALGLGLPVVATAVGGVPELVTHEQTGQLVPPEDVPAVAAALARVVQDIEWAKQLGAKGREHVRSRFSLDAMLDSTEGLYRTLLNGRGTPQ